MALCAILLPRASHADEPVRRKVLALYDSQKNPDVFFTPLHQNLEFALNHLGLEVLYHPYQRPFPTHDSLADYLGVITWNRAPVEGLVGEQYCPWLLDEMKQDRKLVVLEYLGVEKKLNEAAYSPACKMVLRRLGVEYHAEHSDDPLFLEVAEKNPAMMEFERPLNFADPLKYTLLKPVGNEVKVHLKLRRLDLEDSVSSLVVTSAAGGYAHPSYVMHLNLVLDKREFILNPFLFLRTAFSLGQDPVPDTTTQNGRRLFYSQIDGDGIFNVSHIDRKSFAGQIILDEILRHYKNLPITASLITGYFDKQQYHGDHIKKLYRDIFSLPNIEVGAHGHAHPLNWAKGTYAIHVPFYDYSPRHEVQDSVRRMRELMGELKISKPVGLFQWTGNCLPLPEHIAYADEAHLLNINGGDSVFDDRHKSYANLRPLSRLVDKHRQIYSSFGNENIYTNLWHGPFYGYRKVIQSFANTENPLRLKPINIYYHFYSGEHMGSVLSLKQVHDYALTQAIFPVTTTDYIGLVQDYFATQIWRVHGGHRIENQGFARTLRFDGEKNFVDVERSRGVLGFKHEKGSLYVHLDEGQSHEVYLSDKPPLNFYLVESNFALRDWTVTADGLEFSARIWLPPEMLVGGLVPGGFYRVTLPGGQSAMSADLSGKMPFKWTPPAVPGQWQKVRIRREHL